MHLELFSNVFSIEVKLNEFLSVNSLHNHMDSVLLYLV